MGPWLKRGSGTALRYDPHQTNYLPPISLGRCYRRRSRTGPGFPLFSLSVPLISVGPNPAYPFFIKKKTYCKSLCCRSHNHAYMPLTVDILSRAANPNFDVTKHETVDSHTHPYDIPHTSGYALVGARATWQRQLNRVVFSDLELLPVSFIWTMLSLVLAALPSALAPSASDFQQLALMRAVDPDHKRVRLPSPITQK